MAQEKNLPATTRRLSEARKRGQAAKSTEVNTAVILLIALVGLRFFGEFIFQTLGDNVRYYLTNVGEPEVSLANIRAISLPAARTLLITAFPVVVLAAIAGVIANVMQSGLMLSMHPLKPDLGRINPISGAKRLLSAKALVDLVRNIIKLSLLITVFWLSVSVRFDEIAFLGVVDPVSGWQLVPEIGFDAAPRGVAVLGLIGVIDLLWQRYQFRKDLRMSNQEVKQEHKDTEGDPLLRRRIRERGRALAEQRMMAEIPGADVIITNPVHLVIALRYDSVSMHAPTVVAKGQRLIAQRIRDIATEHDIPIGENRPLAQTIFRTVDIGQEIPDTLYKAVAEILAFVFGLKRKAASVGR